MKDLAWIKCGPQLENARIDAFERDWSVCVPAQYRLFLLNRTNGGATEELLYFPVDNLSGGNYSCLGNLCGIDHPKETYRLDWYFDIPEMDLSIVFPFGSDTAGNFLVFHAKGQCDEVLLWDRETSPELTPECLHHVADNLEQFIESLIELDDEEVISGAAALRFQRSTDRENV